MALEGWTGWHGSGKTYNAIAHVLGELDKRGTPVVSNAIIQGHVPSSFLRELVREVPAGELLPQTDVPPVMHFETWDDLMAILELAIAHRWRLQLLIDEAAKFLSSRFYSKMDPRVLMVLQERRKIGAGLDLFWTAPHYEQIDKILRDVTQAVHVCRRWGGSEYSHDSGRPPKVFRVKTYRPTEVTKEKRKAIAKKWVPFSPHLANLYTTGIVSMQGTMAAEVAARPDYLSAEDQADRTPPVVLHVDRPRRAAKRA